MKARDTASVHPSAILEAGVRLGPGVRIWHHCHVRENARLDSGVSIGKDVYIDAGVRIPRMCRVQNGVSIYSGVKLSKYCFIGPHVSFTNDRFPRVGKYGWQPKLTRIETGVSIGAGAIICCGLSVGAFAMIAAGAIVTRPVEPFTLVAGTPATPTKRICACGESRLPLNDQTGPIVLKCCRAHLIPEVIRAAEGRTRSARPHSTSLRLTVIRA